MGLTIVRNSIAHNMLFFMKPIAETDPGCDMARRDMGWAYFRYHEPSLDGSCAMQHDASVSSIFLQENRFNPPLRRVFFLVRPAGRTYLEVKVLYSPGKGKS
jgi:hypothetical protein